MILFARFVSFITSFWSFLVLFLLLFFFSSFSAVVFGVFLFLVTLVVFFLKWFFRKGPCLSSSSFFVFRISGFRFPSAHASRVAGLFFLSLFSGYWFFSLFSLVLFIVTLWSRFYLRKHDFVDLFFGSLVGFLVALLVVFSVHYFF